MAAMAGIAAAGLLIAKYAGPRPVKCALTGAPLDDLVYGSKLVSLPVQNRKGDFVRRQVHVTDEACTEFNAGGIVPFAERLRDRNRGDIVVVIDGGRQRKMRAGRLFRFIYEGGAEQFDQFFRLYVEREFGIVQAEPETEEEPVPEPEPEGLIPEIDPELAGDGVAWDAGQRAETEEEPQPVTALKDD
ncbi:hypothetical protein ACFL26_00670 [Patescibacteria group bacterium]